MKNLNLILVLLTVALYLSLTSISVRSQQASLGAFAGQSDVGKPSKLGSATYDSERQEYTVAGSGTNMWVGRDEFHFVWQRLKGNFILTTRAQFVGKGVEEHRKM